MALFFRHSSCERELRQLADRLETTEKRLRSLDADFTDLWDRVHRQVQRIVKRAERAEGAEQPLPVGGAAPMIDAVSARIIARRNHRGLPPVAGT